MEYYNNNILAVNYEDINTIISYNTLNSLNVRGKVERLVRGGNGREALYSVDSFPKRYKDMIYDKYPNIKEEAKAKPLLDNITIDAKATEFFSNYMLPDGRHLTSDKQREYVNNASILNRCKEILEKSNSQRERQSKRKFKKTEFWAMVSEALKRISEDYYNSLPKDSMRLNEKFKQYLKGGYDVLVNGRFMNRNNSKVDDDVKESLITQLLADRRNLDNEQIARLYNLLAVNLSWKQITGACVGVWREKLDLITTAGRKGETSFRNTKTMQNKRSKPTTAMLYWTADGWDVELLYQKTIEDKKGHRVTTYHNRLTLVVVLDTCVNYPIGYAIGEGENPELIQEALRNAVNHTRDLFGERLRVNQFQCDHYAMKTMTPFYNTITERLTPARVKNAKSKVVEPYFKRLNKKYCQLMPNWSGFGITSKKENQPNTDALNRLRHNFPDMEGCIRQVAWIIEKERAEKIQRYRELYELLPQERRLPLTEEQYLLNFGKENKRNGEVLTNKLEGNGINITIEGKKEHYDCFDMAFRKYSYMDWIVKYDPDDLHHALAVSKEGDLRFMLENKYVQPMALLDRKQGDDEELKRVDMFNKSLEKHVIDTLCLAQEKTRNILIENRGKIDSTLSKLVLCDSEGQHKNRRNLNRINEKEIEETNYVAVDFKKQDEGDEDLADLY